MSVILMGKIWQADLPAMDKIVLLKMADCAHDDGQSVWPSVATIQKECGCSERHVQNVIKRYIDTGLLVLVKGENSGRKTREYAFDLNALDGITVVTPAPRAPVPPHPVHPTPAPGAPKPSVNRPMNRQKNTPSPVSGTESPTDRTIPTQPLPPAENSANGQVIELKDAKPEKQYAFQGEMFRITVKDFQKWRRSYWAIPDLMAMLEHIDLWYANAEDGKLPKRIFFAVAGWLNNEHQKRKDRGATMPRWLLKEQGKC